MKFEKGETFAFLRARQVAPANFDAVGVWSAVEGLFNFAGFIVCVKRESSSVGKYPIEKSVASSFKIWLKS